MSFIYSLILGAFFITAVIMVSWRSCNPNICEYETINNLVSFERKVVYSGEFEHGIRNIQIGDYHRKEGKEIAILGGRNAVVLSANGFTLLQNYFYPDSDSSGEELVEGNWLIKYKLLSTGGGFADVGLMDGNGEYLWRYPGESHTMPKMVVQDIDGDGSSEIYVSSMDGLFKQH